MFYIVETSRMGRFASFADSAAEAAEQIAVTTPNCGRIVSVAPSDGSWEEHFGRA